MFICTEICSFVSQSSLFCIAYILPSPTGMNAFYVSSLLYSYKDLIWFTSQAIRILSQKPDVLNIMQNIIYILKWHIY